MKCVYRGEWDSCSMKDVVVWGGETLMTNSDGECCCENDDDYDLCDWCDIED